MKGISDRSGFPVGDQVSLNNHPNIAQFRKERLVLHEVDNLSRTTTTKN